MLTSFKNIVNSAISRTTQKPLTLGITVNVGTLYVLTLTLVVCFFLPCLVSAQYFPPSGGWEHRKPGEVGFDAAAIEAAIKFAQANETQNPRDLLETHYRSFAREPFGEEVWTI